MNLKSGLRLTALAGGLGLLGYGMYRHFSYQANLLKNYCYKIKNYKFTKVTKDDIRLNFELLIQNNSDLDIEITGYNLSVDLNSKNVALIDSEKSIMLPNNSVSPINLDVSFNPSRHFSLDYVITMISYFFYRKEAINVRVYGNVSVKSGFLQFSNLPIDINWNLAETNNDNNETKNKCSL